jgi:hypothetical protein
LDGAQVTRAVIEDGGQQWLPSEKHGRRWETWIVISVFIGFYLRLLNFS